MKSRNPETDRESCVRRFSRFEIGIEDSCKEIRKLKEKINTRS